MGAVGLENVRVDHGLWGKGGFIGAQKSMGGQDQGFLNQATLWQVSMFTNRLACHMERQDYNKLFVQYSNS